ncbi:NfeD family protein [Paenibacillus protaetiae]|uniref:Nodulation protein NfeD n=1 Tax=Paenibacillus protaetiae TaxID=2509456 RepID=A0A4P6EUG6_9BACL|nr:NfeD family protein [Paenibacillus protaetiae]QAY66306.1 nodulation protein NfeD [Paenibacillus protaetiae]
MQLLRWPKLVLLGCMLAAWLSFAVGASAVHAAAEGQAAQQASAAGPAVVVIPAEQTIESGLEAFLRRAYKEAEEARAERVILTINTFGGAVTSAEQIGELIRKSPVPTTVFVEGKAVSAGTYIALNAEQIVMEPGSTIGAAAVVNGSGDLIDNPKTVSFWTKMMMEAAALHGRNPDIAAAMVNKDVTLSLPDSGISKDKGQILTLSADEAQKAGYADHIAGSVEETIAWLGLDSRDRIDVKPSPAEQLARYLVDPYIRTLLLIIGVAGIALELIVTGLGFPALIGAISFGLYFFGHYVAGFAGKESIALFVLGLILLILELFVPSFGALGIVGSISLIAGVMMAASDPLSALLSLAVAIVLAAIVIGISIKKFGHRGIWNKFILREKLTADKGFVPAETKVPLVGREGVAVTPLRPAGTVQIGEERVDVVTSGEFIKQGAAVVVTKAEGTWVFVKEKKETV